MLAQQRIVSAAENRTVLSLNQEKHLYQQWLLGPGRFNAASRFVVKVRIPFTGPLDLVAMQQALHKMTERHDALRTSFSQVGGALSAHVGGVAMHVARLPMVRQVLSSVARRHVPRASVFRKHIADECDIRLQHLDLSELAAAEHRTALRELEGDNSTLDLTVPPLCRASLVKHQADYHVLTLTFSHLICDGWSAEIIRRELLDAYRALTTRQPWAPPSPQITFGDYAAWERAVFTGEGGKEALSYWAAQLPGFSPLTSPFDARRLAFARSTGTPETPGRGSQLTIRRLQGVTQRQLRRIAQSLKISPFMFLVALVAIALSRWSGERKINIWSPFANRTTDQTKSVVGWFAQRHLLAFVVDDRQRFADFLTAVRHTVFGALQHQGFPLALLTLRNTAAILKPADQTALSVTFSMPSRQVGPTESVNQTPLAYRWQDPALTDGGLLIAALARDDRMHIAVSYALDWFEQKSIETWIDDFEALLAAAMHKGAASVSDLLHHDGATTPAEWPRR